MFSVWRLNVRVFRKMLGIFLISIFIFPIFGCAGNEQKTGYDGREYDISVSGNGSATLSVKKGSDGGYALTVSGSGQVADYSKKEEVPWNVIMKKVTSVVVEDGVKNIGDYFFFATNIKEYFLPSSVESVGEHSFPSGAVLYSYTQAEFDTDYEIYFYCAEKPFAMNKYFRLIDGVPKVWRDYSVLFIGNSFTFRQGTEDSPMVPYLFGKIAESLGETVNADFVVKSAYTLTKYADKTDEKGAIVEQKLTQNQYDFIVLQEQSTTPVNSYNAFNTAVGKLINRISETQKKAKVFLYATWGYPAGLDKTASETVSEMNSKLKVAYDNCGSGYGLKVTHVGDAFLDVYTNHSEIELYAADDMHQSNIGAYLSACCHVSSIFGIDVRNSDFTHDFDASVCKILQETAYAVSFVK